MTIHAIRQYIKYLWTARGRHGTHSPFAYTFIEEVLQGKNQNEYRELVEIDELPARFKILPDKVAQHFRYKAVKLLRGKDDTGVTCAGDTLILILADPSSWEVIADKYFPVLTRNSAVFIPGIHKTTKHTESWNLLRNRPQVQLCIDLYEAGLFFFNDDFKEKQHFVLRY